MRSETDMEDTVKEKLIPRDYQIEIRDACLSCIERKETGLVYAVVGSGKTLCFSLLSEAVNFPVLVLQPNRELTLQNEQAAINMGIKDVGVYCATLKRKEINNLTFATPKSVKASLEDFKQFRVILIDEADFLYPNNKPSDISKIIDFIKPISVIGFTGTPYYLKNNLFEGSVIKLMIRVRPKNFKKLIASIQPDLMVEKNYWSDLKYTTYDFDNSLLELNSTGAEFTGILVRESLSHLSINNNIFILCKRMLEAGRKDILLFCNSIEDAMTFEKHLPDCRAVTSKTPLKLRNQIIEDFKNQKVKILVNVGVFQAGFSYERLQTVILGDVTNSLRKYVQWVGRVNRRHPDKEYGEIIDFGGNTLRFGDIRDLRIVESDKGLVLVSKDKVISGVSQHELGEHFIDENNKMYRKFRAGYDLGEYTLNWGNKYYGKKLKNISRNYLSWMIKNANYYPVEVDNYVNK